MTTGDERDQEERKRDRQMIELLNELRVALPGVQILFAFLLTVPFTQRFPQLTTFQRDTFYVTLVAATIPVITRRGFPLRTIFSMRAINSPRGRAPCSPLRTHINAIVGREV